MYISAKKNLNAENVETLSTKKIRHIGKMYKKEYYSHYKKKTFFSWFFDNLENTESFIRRVKKLLKKLEIDLTDKEQIEIEALEAREFTTRRAFKTIEAPYLNNEKSVTLKNNIFFLHRDVRTYIKKKELLVKIYTGELLLTAKEIVFYDRDNDEIQKVINFEDISGIVLKKYAVIIKVIGRKDIYVRYKDNELLYISLKRAIKTKSKVNFSKDEQSDNTIEKTLETILKIN